MGDGRSPWARASAQGINANAENIAAGSSSAQGSLNQWKGSNGHCKNMMNPSARLIGIGYAHNADATYKHYWTEMLSNSDLSVDQSCYPQSGNLRRHSYGVAAPEYSDGVAMPGADL